MVMSIMGLEPRMTALAKPAAIVNDRPILSTERVLLQDYDRKFAVKKIC
jgi:hypothetical protein